MTSPARSSRALIVFGVFIAVSMGAESYLFAAQKADEARIVQLARPGSPEATVQAALVAALQPDELKAFEAYLELVHPSLKRAKRKKARRGKETKRRISSRSQAIERIRRYSWKRFRAQAADYVLPESSGGFTLARMDPPQVTPTTRFVRIFVAPTNNTRRTTPPPIRLERSEERWLITSNSL